MYKEVNFKVYMMKVNLPYNNTCGVSLNFTRKTGPDIVSYGFTPMETTRMKFQALLSTNNKLF